MEDTNAPSPRVRADKSDAVEVAMNEDSAVPSREMRVDEKRQVQSYVSR